MTSVQDYLRNLRAARQEVVNKTASETPPGVAARPEAAAPQAVTSSPWLKSPAIRQPSSSDLGQGEPVSAARLSAPRATSTPLKPYPSRSGGAPARPAAEGSDSDTDTNISHLIDQLSLKSALKPPPAPSSSTAAAGAGAAPRRSTKMDMLRRKFSASSPTKSSTDLGSSGGAASLGRARTRSRSSVSILDQKIILSGISGDEDSSGSSSSSGGTSSSNPIRTESVAGARRAASGGEVSEQLWVSATDSVVPTVPSASSVRTETVASASSVDTESVESPESVQTTPPTEDSVQTEEPTEQSATSDSESTIKSASRRSVRSIQARAVREAKYDSKSESEPESASQSQSESESESSGVPAETDPAVVSSESTPLVAATGGASANHIEPDPVLVMRSDRKQTDPASGRPDRRTAERQESKRRETKRQEAKHQKAKRQEKTERSARQPSKRHSSSARRDRDRSEGDRVHPDDTSARDRHRRAKRASKAGEEGRLAPDSRGHRRSEPTAARQRTDGAALASSAERHRRRRDRDDDWSLAECELERTDASESLVVSYQRRVARSSGGCRHCRRQAWPPPPPPPPPPAVTVVLPAAALGGAAGARDAVRFSTAANSPVFVDADEDAVLSAMLTQQVALTRHFLAAQKQQHQMYCRTLRQTQRQVYTHRDDLKGSGRRRRGGGVPAD